MERRTEGRKDKPTINVRVEVFALVREAAGRTTFFDDPEQRAELARILSATPHSKSLGPRLVELLGVEDSREFVAGVRKHARLVGRTSPQRREAIKATVKWADYTEPCIRDDGWHEPEPPAPPVGHSTAYDLWGSRR